MISLRCGAAMGLLIAALAVAHPALAADEARKANDYLGRGANAFRLGDVIQATQDWTEAIRFCRIAGDRALESEALSRRGEAFSALGHVGRAKEDLTAALRLAESAGDAGRLAAALGALGNAYFLSREPDQARPLLDRSLDLARRHGLAGIRAANANNLGNLLAAAGENQAALAAYAESVEAARAAADATLASTALANAARVHAGSGRTEEADRLLAEAARTLSPVPASRAKAFGLIAIGRQAQTMAADAPKPQAAARLRLAYASLREATIVGEQIGDPRVTSLAFGSLGNLYEESGRREEAASLTQRAEFLAQRANAPELLYRWQWQNGRLASAAGDVDGAIGALRRAVFSLQSIRQDIPVEYRDGRSSFRETLGPLFFGLADYLLQRAARARSTAEAEPLLTEARDTIELLKAAELQDYFKDECVTRQQQATIEDVGKRTVAIYPIILRDRIELLLSLPDGKRQITVRVTEKQLTDEVRAMRQFLEKRTTREFIPHAQKIYDWLIRPMDAELRRQEIDTLVIIPDGPLRTIPMGTLFDGEQFLINRYAIATAPGLTMVDPQPLARRSLSILLTGLSQSRQGYPALPNVTGEIEAIGRLHQGRVLTDERFLLPQLEQELKRTPYSVVHIASHGEFDSDPQRSFLLTYDGKLTLNRLEGAVKYGQFRSDPLELLTLSACRTAAGDDRAALGLAGVAIKSGARSALASLWFISDQASSQLVTDFYELIKDPSLSKAKALQQAQVNLMNDRRFRHPGYWGAFLMIGNWL